MLLEVSHQGGSLSGLRAIALTLPLLSFCLGSVEFGLFGYTARDPFFEWQWTPPFALSKCREEAHHIKLVLAFSAVRSLLHLRTPPLVILEIISFVHAKTNTNPITRTSHPCKVVQEWFASVKMDANHPLPLLDRRNTTCRSRAM